jgi:hypothetical protein
MDALFDFLYNSIAEFVTKKQPDIVTFVYNDCNNSMVSIILHVIKFTNANVLLHASYEEECVNHLIINNKDYTTHIWNPYSILRYIGKVTKTYPTQEASHMVTCDCWLHLHLEFVTPLMIHGNPQQYGLQTHCAEWRNTHVERYMNILDNELSEHTYIGGMNKPTIVDFCWLFTLEKLKKNLYSTSYDTTQFKNLDQYMTSLACELDLDL